MKKTILAASVLTLALAGCSKDPAPAQTTPTPATAQQPGGGEQAATSEQNIFQLEDIDKAVDETNQYIVMLNGLHGQTLRSGEEMRAAQKEIGDKLKAAGIMHAESHVLLPENTAYRNKDGRIQMPASSFAVHSDQAKETYYANINAHVLTIPVDFTTLTGTAVSYPFTFVKTTDNQVQLLDALMVSGPDLKKKDEDAYYDTIGKADLQQKIKEMNIQ